jgi:membrane glycosyltransferase
LQHTLVLFGRGIRGVSRIHFLMGIFGYLASPLWLLFLVTFNWSLWTWQRSELTPIVVRARTPFIEMTGTQHALLIFAICMAVLFLPKCLSLLDLAFDRRRRLAFGGLRRAAVSAVLETIFSSLHAPLQMLWHSKFVATILFGMGVHWGPQKRTPEGVPWSQALRRHWGHTLTGILWGAFVLHLDPPSFWWFLPVVAGMVLSVPLSVLTSRSGLGARTRNLGLFLTPEETSPPSELDTLRVRMALLEKSAAARSSDASIAEAVLDPYVNAIHVSLLREKQLNPEYRAAFTRLGAGRPEVRELGEKLLVNGPATLTVPEKILVLSDADVVSWLHRQAWIRSGETLSPWWQQAIGQYTR